MTKNKLTEKGFAGINYRATTDKMLRNQFREVPEKNSDQNK
ncbi:hypothetical protein [Desulforamulus aquiferis]|uniref:Uncharacterized protein n=1 Tax=Desulforamulus aquiferis TaxID=1397668 RepID=A0AAW7ZBC5_9FIRM|nr:hypothetical protein [Desulforamulus aquiferis]MDO7786520.1 hypothetical protein [Desulforamulus aquiferis]